MLADRWLTFLNHVHPKDEWNFWNICGPAYEWTFDQSVSLALRTFWGSPCSSWDLCYSVGAKGAIHGYVPLYRLHRILNLSFFVCKIERMVTTAKWNCCNGDYIYEAFSTAPDTRQALKIYASYFLNIRKCLTFCLFFRK